MDHAHTVERALAILELLGKHKMLTAGQINEYLGYHRSTTYRLLATLKQLHYIQRDKETGLYSLSKKILTLASSILEDLDVAGVAKPFLEELQRKSGETVHLAALDHGEVVYLDKIESTKTLRVVMSSRTGLRAPLYCTGIGKVFLAAKNEQALNAFLDSTELAGHTEHTITDRTTLLAELEKVRTRGYALDREEHEVGVFCVAAPVKGPSGLPIASLSVSLPSVRRTADLEKRLILEVQTTAEAIGSALSGYRGDPGKAARDS